MSKDNEAVIQEIEDVLTKLENAVSLETQLRLGRSRQGRSPKSIHSEALAALTACIERLVDKGIMHGKGLLAEELLEKYGGIAPTLEITDRLEYLRDTFTFQGREKDRSFYDAIMYGKVRAKS